MLTLSLAPPRCWSKKVRGTYPFEFPTVCEGRQVPQKQLSPSVSLMPEVPSMLQRCSEKGKPALSPGRAGAMEESEASCPDGAGAGRMTGKEKQGEVESTQGTLCPRLKT